MPLAGYVRRLSESNRVGSEHDRRLMIEKNEMGAESFPRPFRTATIRLPSSARSSNALEDEDDILAAGESAERREGFQDLDLLVSDAMPGEERGVIEEIFPNFPSAAFLEQFPCHR